MPFLWHNKAWEDYLFWVDQDRKTAKRINQLLKEIARSSNSMPQSGKAEMLKHSLRGLSSLRIDKANRLVYKVSGDTVEVISCRGHYEDR